MTRHDPAEAGPHPREYAESTPTSGTSPDPETVAAEIVDTFGAAEAVAIAETIGELATDRGRCIVVPVGPTVASVTIAGRLGSRALAVDWVRRVLDALGHPTTTEDAARGLVARVDDHERRLVALETTTRRLTARVAQIENGGAR